MGRAPFRWSWPTNLNQHPVDVERGVRRVDGAPINIGPDPAPAGGFVSASMSPARTPTSKSPAPPSRSGRERLRERDRAGCARGTANVTVSNPNYAPSTTVVTSRAELNIVRDVGELQPGPAATDDYVAASRAMSTQMAAQPALTVTLTSRIRVA